jgi:5-(carboxyamino)imidazole ribonucleotide synthase
MTNILGADGFSGDYVLEGLSELAATQGAYLHWYNKSTSKPGRKMGHYTILSESLEDAIEKAHNLRTALRTSPSK